MSERSRSSNSSSNSSDDDVEETQQQDHNNDSSMSSSEAEEDENANQSVGTTEKTADVEEGDQESQVNEEEEMVNDEDEDEAGEKETTKNGGEDDEADAIYTTKYDDGIEEDEVVTGADIMQEDEEEEATERDDKADHAMEGMELSGDEEEEQGPTNINLDIARCKIDLGDEGPYFVKLPNFLSIDTKPFDIESYDDELEEDEVLDDDGRTRLKLKMENTIRWRILKDEHGNERRESNAKIVRWSDGTSSEISVVRLLIDQLSPQQKLFEMDKQRIMDFNHLYIRHGVALQAQSVFREKLIFRPHSTDTLTHRKMTMNMAEKTSKAQKVRMLANVGDDPHEKKKELIRLEEEKLRAIARREAQQRRVRERPRAMGLTSGFLEGYDSDEGGAESLAAIKRRYQHAPYGMSEPNRSYYSESDEEVEERRQRKTISEAKIDSDEEDMETSDTEQRQSKQSNQQQKKKIVIEDDEDG